MGIIARNGDFSSPNLILCEGSGDVAFLDALLTSRGVSGFDIGCPNKSEHGAEGLSGIRNYLDALLAKPNANSVRTFVIMVDSDLNPQKRFERTRKLIESFKLEPPHASWEKSNGSPATAVITVPGRNLTGELEHLLMRALRANNNELNACIEQFMHCVKRPLSWSDNKLEKARVACAIAGTCEDDPASSLSWVWSRRSQPFLLSSPVFDEIADFLRTLVTKDG